MSDTKPISILSSEATGEASRSLGDAWNHLIAERDALRADKERLDTLIHLAVEHGEIVLSSEHEGWSVSDLSETDTIQIYYHDSKSLRAAIDKARKEVGK